MTIGLRIAAGYRALPMMWSAAGEWPSFVELPVVRWRTGGVGRRVAAVGLEVPGYGP